MWCGAVAIASSPSERKELMRVVRNSIVVAVVVVVVDWVFNAVAAFKKMLKIVKFVETEIVRKIYRVLPDSFFTRESKGKIEIQQYNVLI